MEETRTKTTPKLTQSASNPSFRSLGKNLTPLGDVRWNVGRGWLAGMTLLAGIRQLIGRETGKIEEYLLFLFRCESTPSCFRRDEIAPTYADTSLNIIFNGYYLQYICNSWKTILYNE